jgi:2-keto-4-pentenoate hydratase/2-oxohepta-3-ene-1,7-dioic acid hydratase in catechol pathway
MSDFKPLTVACSESSTLQLPISCTTLSYHNKSTKINTDLVFTGTPSGIGPLHVGDVVRAKCDDILPECVFEVGPEST